MTGTAGERGEQLLQLIKDTGLPLEELKQPDELWEQLLAIKAVEAEELLEP